jgi:hypothetical protein
MFSKRLLIALVLALLALAGPASAQTIPRIDQDFVKWTQDTVDGNHPEGSNAYADLDDLGLAAAAFRAAAEAFLAEDWSDASSLADAVDYDVVAFRDTATGETYYGLLPEADNDDGRGFFFLRPRAGVQRRLVLEAAHAVEDNRTGVLGSEIFRASGARALLLSGSDRCASDEESGCTGDTDCGNHRVSDAAHSVDTFFHIFHELASTEHADTRTLQIHGFKAEGTDPEFSVSDGTETKNGSDDYLPNAFYLNLQGRMAAVNPGLTRNGNSCNSSLPGQGEFKCGTQNVQGRHLNGSADACGTEASSASGRFVHLEMSNDLREPGLLYSQQLVIDAVNAVFPRVASVGDLIWADLDEDGSRQSNERGVHGVTVEVLDANDAVVGSTTTIVGGFRIGNLAPGTYRLRVQLPPGYSAGTGLDPNGRALTTFTVAAGESLTDRDLALVPPSLGQIGDRVWHDANGDGRQTGETGVGGVSVQLLTADEYVVATGTTDAQGLYSFGGVLPGDYKLSVQPGTRGNTKQVSGAPNDDSDIDPRTGTSASFNLASGASDTSRDAGLLSPCFDLTLVAKGSRWKWWTPSATDSVPSGWNAASFTGAEGAPWQEGAAPLGYGTSKARTVITVPDRLNGAYTTYFRLAFVSPDPAVVERGLQLELTRNDGVVVYLNGAEVLRRNLPWGLIPGFRTPASTDVNTTETVTIPVSALVAGTNVIAVELHQSVENDDSSGLFEIGLTGRICQSCRVGEVELGGLVSTYISNDTGKSGSNFDTLLKLETDGSPAKKALLRWNTLPAVLTGADILRANLQVTVATGSGSSSHQPYGFYALLRSWDPATVTYAHPWDPDGIDAADRGSERLGVTPLNPALGETVTIPLTEAGVQVVEQWVSGTLANNGLVLQAEPGSENGLDLQSDRTASPPRLTVLYVRPASACTP